MSKNLYKAAWVVVSGDEKHVIDSNSLMEKRMEELEALRRAGGQQPEEGYEGGGAEAVDALLSDRDGGSGIIKAAPAEPVPDLEEIRAQAQQMIDDAQAHIDEMQQAAESEIEAKRRWAMEEGKKEGYGEGYRKGIAEADGMKQQLMALTIICSTKIKNPHKIKFQAAPCQNPVKNHTTSRLKIVRTLPLRFPPSGMYTYSRNHAPSVICHLRQNSVTLRAI